VLRGKCAIAYGILIALLVQVLAGFIRSRRTDCYGHCCRGSTQFRLSQNFTGTSMLFLAEVALYRRLQTTLDPLVAAYSNRFLRITRLRFPKITFEACIDEAIPLRRLLWTCYLLLYPRCRFMNSKKTHVDRYFVYNWAESVRAARPVSFLSPGSLEWRWVSSK